MRYLITVVIAALSLNAFGQTDGWEYPFPYNPDGDTDGYIGLNDLLDLLALYGNEYPDSFHFDDSGAILYLGQLSLSDCYNQARVAEGNWRLPNRKDIMRWSDYLVQEFDEIQTANFPENYGYVVEYDMHAIDESNKILRSKVTITKGYNNGATEFKVIDALNQYNSTTYSVLSTTNEFFNINSNYCYVVTEVRPDIEYHVVQAAVTDLEEEVNDSLANGWNLNGGFSSRSTSNCYQAIWRWAVE